MNLYNLLNEIENKRVAVKQFEYKESEYTINFEPDTVFYDGYSLMSLRYAEWEETFYIVAKDYHGKLEFIKCSDGELIKIKVSVAA